MFRRTALLAATLPLALLAFAGGASAHCQVPCGIYDDPARIQALREDTTTIAKAIAQIGELAGKGDAQSLNQAVRWITTKDQHASNVITVCSEYFLTQKIKPVAKGADGYDAYVEHLAAVHAIMVAAMKTKQQADPAAATALGAAIDAFAAMHEKDHAH
jgi:nickel superoxide dismutase